MCREGERRVLGGKQKRGTQSVGRGGVCKYGWNERSENRGKGERTRNKGFTREVQVRGGNWARGLEEEKELWGCQVCVGAMFK